MDNRRLLIAALLSVGVLFLWQVLFPPPEPPQRPAEAPASAAAPVAAPTTPAVATAPAAPGEGASAPALAPVADTAERRVVLENTHLRAEFSNRGAALVSLTLLEKTGEDGRPLELVQRRGATPYPFALLDAAGAAHALAGALHEVEPGATASEASFLYRGPEGSSAKRFHLREDGRLDFELRVETAGGWAVLAGPGIRARSQAELESRFDRRAAAWWVAGEVEVLDAAGAEEARRLAAAGLGWIGLEDTYFLAAFVPETGLAEARIEPVLLAPTDATGVAFDALPFPADGELTAEQKALARDLRLVLVPAAGELVGTSYWGAKQYDRLASFRWGLEKTVRWGWLGFLARPMLLALQWIHAHLTPNYGWAIVWLTVALKIVLLPLSLASFKSMRKMQKLSPKMQAVRERYRPKLRDKSGRFNPDVQRQMNEEIMALYRTEGVNPAGGCLPMLVQLPIFFAFYQLLSTAVELWRSPWALWIHDLTAPDPRWVLPIVMGITQFVQTKMTPAPPDPVQRRLMQAMPIVFTVFSLGFPAGLVLYWLTNNVLSIGQQAIYNSLRERAEAEEAEAAKPARRPRGEKS